MDEALRDKIAEEFNQPEYVTVEAEAYQRMLEELEYFKTTIGFIKEELNSENAEKEKEDSIRAYINELEEEILYVF